MVATLPALPEAERGPTVPHTVLDIGASITPAPIVVEFIAGTAVVPALSARQWLAVLLSPGDLEDCLARIFPGLTTDPGYVDDLIADDLLAGEIDEDEISMLPLYVVAEAAGRPWWVAMRLVEVCRGAWHTLGPRMLTCGLDLDRVGLGAWMDVLLVQILEAIPRDQAEMFSLKLTAVPVDLASDEEAKAAEPTMDMAAWVAMGG